MKLRTVFSFTESFVILRLEKRFELRRMIHHRPEKHNVRRGCLQCWSIEKQKCNFH